LNISRYTGPIFANFSPYEIALCADDGSVPFFQFVKGRCYGNQIMLRKCYQRRLIPIAFVALVPENELQYHGLAGCINSANDATILLENFVKFGAVSTELTQLICERQVRHSQKNWHISSNISLGRIQD